MNKKPEFRVEKDVLGDVEIPAAAYWGIRTARANLVVSGFKPHKRLSEALVLLKRCSLSVSLENGGKNGAVSHAILASCDEILNGKLQEEFIADPYHCGAGAAHNANVNDVIANRAEEILGGSVGTYSQVHPDTDVDRCPGLLEIEFRNAARIALLIGFKELELVLLDLERLLRRKSLELGKVLQSNDANNHSVDSWKLLAPELNTYGSIIERCHRRIVESTAGLLELNLPDTFGGGAVETVPIAAKLVESISVATGLRLKIAEEGILPNHSTGEFLQFSSALKELMVELSRISVNLHSACHKVSLPSETLLTLATCQITANDYAIAQCSQVQQAATVIPFVANTLLKSLDLLHAVLSHFNLNCIAEIVP